MRPNEYLVAVSGEKGSVSLATKWDFVEIKLIGTSVPASVPCDTTGLNSLTIAPETNKEGIIAVELTKTTNYGKNRERVAVYHFLHVKNKEGKSEINMNDEWFPTGDRLGQIANGEIEVVINGKWYTTDEYYDPNFKYENIRKTGKSFVPDGGVLMCQYLMGDIDAQTIIDAASEVKTPSIEEVLTENASLKTELKGLQGVVENQLATIQNRKDKIVELVHKLDDQTKANDSAKEKIKALQNHARALWDILEEINSVHDYSFGKRKNSLWMIRMCLDKGNREWSAARTLGIIPAQ